MGTLTIAHETLRPLGIKSEVAKMTMVADCGTIINKLVVDGRLYGGLIQGLGLDFYVTQSESATF